MAAWMTTPRTALMTRPVSPMVSFDSGLRGVDAIGENADAHDDGHDSEDGSDAHGQVSSASWLVLFLWLVGKAAPGRGV